MSGLILAIKSSSVCSAARVFVHAWPNIIWSVVGTDLYGYGELRTFRRSDVVPRSSVIVLYRYELNTLVLSLCCMCMFVLSCAY